MYLQYMLVQGPYCGPEWMFLPCPTVLLIRIRPDPDRDTNLDFVPDLTIHNYLCMKKIGPFLQILKQNSFFG
jgi:hypothetical protein